MVEINVFTNQSPRVCANHIQDRTKEWLESYLSIDGYDDSDLADLLAFRMVGETKNGWHCENIVIHPEFIFDRVIEGWDWKKGQLLQAMDYVFQLLELIEDGKRYHVFKFSDEYERELNRIFYSQIYGIEQMIRSTLTTIFYPKHPEMIYRIAEMYKVDLKNYDADEMKRHKKGFQNEFFHLELSSYKTFKGAELLTKSGVVNMSEGYDDLASFIEAINNYGLLTEDEAGLLVSLSAYLAEIQNFRNCIMHSRAYGPDDIESFEKAREKLTELLLNFQNNDGRKIVGLA